MTRQNGSNTRTDRAHTRVPANGLTAAGARRTLNAQGKVLRKLRSFLATAVSVNPPCKRLIYNVKNRGCCTN